jgi:RNA polymerase sigma-70 factor (sigma-E family)
LVGEDGLRELYEGCYRRLVGQLYGVTGDWADAQDAVQEAFVRALGSRHKLETLDNPEAWLRTTAVNVARSRWRRLRRFDVLVSVGREALPKETELPGLTPDRADLMNALRALPANQREAIALHHIADLPVAEIAGILRVPVGTVKARLSRGRARLAELLADDVAAPTEARRD